MIPLTIGQLKLMHKDIKKLKMVKRYNRVSE